MIYFNFATFKMATVFSALVNKLSTNADGL